MKYALLIYGTDLVPETSDAETRQGWIEYARAAKEAGILIDVPDLDTALDWAARMPHATYGTAEVRAVRTGMNWQAALG